MAIQPAKGVAQKIETFLGQLDKAGFTFIDHQAEPRHQPTHFLHRRFTFSTVAANDKIIGIIDDVGTQPSIMAELRPRQQETTEVEICQ